MMAKYSALCLFLFCVCWAIISGCTIDESEVTCKSIEELHQLNTYKEFEFVQIDTQNEKLPIITNDAFKGMNNVKGVVITNKVSNFEPYALRGIGHPFKFLMENFTLEELPVEFFAGVPVFGIMLINGHLKKLKPNMFNNTPLLNETYIERNKLTKIESDVFSNTNIVRVELSHNEIATIEDGAFTSMKNLRILDLSTNKLTTFDAEKVFDSSNSLEVLHLSDNLLTAVSRFPTLPKLHGLMFARNAIATIERKSFDKLKSLNGIDFSFNKLKSIPPDTLSGDMMVLGVGNNPWTCSYLTELQTWAKKENVTLSCNDERDPCSIACV